MRVVYLTEHENYPAALRCLDTLIRIDPKESENYLRQGNIYVVLGRYKDAKDSFTKLMQINPAFKEAWLLRANTWCNLNQSDSAIKDMTKIVGVRRDLDSLIYLQRAKAFYNVGNFAQAKNDIDSYAAFHPTDYNYYALRMNININLNKIPAVIDDLTIMIDRNNQPDTLLRKRALFYANIKEWGKCIADCNVYLSKVESEKLDPTIYFLRATSYYCVNNYVQAKKDIDAYAKFNPREDYFYSLRADIRKNLNENSGAIEDLTVLIKRSPAADTLVRQRAVLYSLTGEWLKCVTDCNSYLSKSPNDILTIFTRGTAFLKLKYNDKASADFETCAKMKSGSSQTVLYRGYANFYLARDKEALKDLTKAWAWNQSNGNLLMMIAHCKHAVNPGSACAEVKQALTLGSKDAARFVVEYCE